jgi:hypothetical protein
MSILRVADAAAGVLGLRSRGLSPDPLVRTAIRRTGLSDFGELEILEPLGRLLDACAGEADLSLFGRFATQWDVVRFLSNLLRLRAAERCNPAILNEPIEQPIFITGLPRSGTTFLHRLMMEDSGNRAPRVWETIYPGPAEPGHDRRAARADRQLRAFERIAPEFRALHPLNAQSPQECSEITAHVFRSLRFDTTYRVPSYRRWLDVDGHLPAYRFHRRFLQHLKHASLPVRWVLKCPDHLFALRDLRLAYPDARVVFVHRDPVKVLLSLTQLTEVLRRPFSRHVDPARIGAEESARWYEGALRMIEADEDGGFAEPICHVHYLDLIADPVSTVETVYGHFGLQLPREAAERMARTVVTQPNGGYGRHRYRLEDHGIDPGTERDKFRGYMVHFGIDTESARTTRRSAIVMPIIPPARTGAR